MSVNWYDKAGFEVLLENARRTRKTWRSSPENLNNDELWEEHKKAKSEYMKFCEDALYDEREEFDQPRDTFGLGESGSRA